MKTLFRCLCFLSCSFSLFVPGLLPAGEPLITSVTISGGEVVVVVVVPEGVRKLTLEGRERVGPGSWEPRAVTRSDGSGGTVTFRLPVSRRVELLRVRADDTEALPASFYSGETSFNGQPGGDVLAGMPAVPGGVFPGPGDLSTSEGATPQVVESDIWQVRGQTVYFFNQYRGLQVLDVSDPDAAVLRGTLDLPAAGEQMYLLGDRHLVLLARNGCLYGEGESQVVVLRDDGQGDPAVVATLPFNGSIIESRMVGTALYVASQRYRQINQAGVSTWEWGTLVTGYDLSDPEAPVVRNELWYSGWGSVVSSTDTLFFVATGDPGNWWQSLIRVVDITSPDGVIAEYQSIRAEGRVKDKFKLRYEGGVLTTISEDRHWDNGTRLVTVLETFRLPDPRSAGALGVAKLGELELGRGEQLHGTRFDGDKVYIVTFFQIDPLFVVSLADPAHPRIVGELDVPGWSTYIQPLGDRLVTVGVETNRVAISLFGVDDPANPVLLSRVLLGEGYSWTEANSDEKAFTLLEEEGLILIPYNGYEDGGYASRVQLIDLNRDSLVARGLIEHTMQPRRTTVYEGRILSVSGWELLTVDAADRDHPVVVNELELAWPVDRVFSVGDHLVEVATSTWGSSSSPALRVVEASAPNLVVGGLSLNEMPVWGAARRGDFLYLLQGIAGRLPWWQPVPLAEGEEEEPRDDRNSMTLTVISLENLPALSVVGVTEARSDLLYQGGNLDPVWPTDDLLVWVGGQQFGFWYDFGMPVAGDVMTAGLALPWFWGSSGGNMLAFDVGEASEPAFVSEVKLSANGSWWSFSEPYAAEGKVYLSHQASEYLVVPEAGASTGTGGVAPEGEVEEGLVVVPHWGRYVVRHFLNVVDYADAAHPIVRMPVNIPGGLRGVSRGGALIYTVGPVWTEEGTSDWRDHLVVGAYDGVAVHRVDSMPLPSQWPHPVLLEGEFIYVGVPPVADAAGTGTGAALETWTLPDTGELARLGIAGLDSPANLLAAFPGLVAAQGTDRAIGLFDSSDPSQLRWVGGGGLTGCLWYDFSGADGAVDRGLWLPLGVYGVGTVPIAGP